MSNVIDSVWSAISEYHETQRERNMKYHSNENIRSESSGRILGDANKTSTNEKMEKRVKCLSSYINQQICRHKEPENTSNS